MEIKVTIEGLNELTAAVKLLSETLDIPAFEKDAKTDQKPAKTEQKQPKNEQKAEPAPEPEKPKKKTAGIKPEDVRAKLAEISGKGKQKEVKDLIESFGVNRLSDIPPEKYEELLQQAGEL